MIVAPILSEIVNYTVCPKCDTKLKLIKGVHVAGKERICGLCGCVVKLMNEDEYKGY